MDPAFQQGDTKIGGYVMISGVFYWSFSGTASEVVTACTDIVADNLRPFMYAMFPVMIVRSCKLASHHFLVAGN